MKIKVCVQKDSCCYVRGLEALKAVRERFPETEIFQSECLGVCKPVVAEIDGKIYSELNSETLVNLIEEALRG